MQEDVPQESAPESLPEQITPPVQPQAGVVEMVVIATCLLQPKANYADPALVQIPFGSPITPDVPEHVERDEHNRPWIRVSFDDGSGAKSGWLQKQNLRPA